MQLITAIAVVGVSSIGSAGEAEPPQANPPEILIKRVERPDADARLADREQLRRLFFDESPGSAEAITFGRSQSTRPRH
jgi:hypothetical protein